MYQANIKSNLQCDCTDHWNVRMCMIMSVSPGIHGDTYLDHEINELQVAAM